MVYQDYLTVTQMFVQGCQVLLSFLLVDQASLGLIAFDLISLLVEAIAMPLIFTLLLIYS